MPIDPSIYATIRPVAPIQTPSPLDLIGTVERVQALREATEQRRLAGEDRRAKAQDEAAARARALQTEQTLQGAMSLDPTTGRPTVDWSKLLGHIPSGTLFTVQKEIAEAEQRVATLRNTNLTGDEKALQYQGIVARPVAAAGYDKTLFDQAVNAAHKAGAITTEQRDAGLALTDPADIKRTTDAAIARAQEYKPPEPFTLSEGQTRYDATGKLIVAAPVKPVKEEHSPIYKEWQDYQSSGGTLPFDAYQTMDANRRRSITQINTGTTSVPGDFARTGDAFLETIPAQWRATVKKIANYDEDPTKVTSMRGGMRETVMQWVNQANPAYDASVFSNRAPTRKAFTTGTQGRQINNINTAIGHIDQLTGLAQDLQTGGFVPANQAWNAIRTAFGSDKVTNFNTLKDALAGEVAGVLSQSGATVSGIADAQAKIQAANSPTQLAGYVKTLIPVMGSKLGSLDYQYHQAMGADDPFSALSPESRRILLKHGVDPAHLTGDTATAPAGGGGGGGSLTFQDYLKSKGKR